MNEGVRIVVTVEWGTYWCCAGILFIEYCVKCVHDWM